MDLPDVEKALHALMHLSSLLFFATVVDHYGQWFFVYLTIIIFRGESSVCLIYHMLTPF